MEKLSHMNEPFYLSLDIDFWNGITTARLTKYLNRVAKIARSKGIHIRAYMNHHHMLDAAR